MRTSANDRKGRMNSPLARLIPNKPDTEQMKRDGWHQHDILVVALNDERLDFIDRQFIERIGNRIYGERVKR